MDILSLLLGGANNAGFLDPKNRGYDESQGPEVTDGPVQDIVATGSRPKLTAEDSPPPANPPISTSVSPKKMQDGEPAGGNRRGMFGVKGTLRDILGVLGDGFLVQSGNKPIYEPQRQRERTGDAMYGFTKDPDAAAERMSSIDPDKALELQRTSAANEIKRAQLEDMANTRQAGIDAKKYKQTQDFGNYAARIMNNANTPEKQAYALKLLQDRAGQYGIDLNEILGTPGMLTEDERNVFSQGDMTVNQQQQLPLAEQRNKIAQQNANSNTVRANRPPQQRAPARVNVVEQIREKMARGEELTAGQKRVYDDSISAAKTKNADTKAARGIPFKASDYTGKIVKSPSGQRFRSDGSNWAAVD